MPWETTENFIGSGHRSPQDFESNTLETVTLSEQEGIKATIGKPKGKKNVEIQNYLFEKSKGWDESKAKAWFSQHQQKVAERVCAVSDFT